ncbi:glycosyltransferase [Dysgonomonas sp. 216]|uniref:glycosyltransferase family 4 protein n=1 Tax=Dysgonomonas sp. 216 TaxID=2302934 RepID=UPI0013D0A779|nr:glycosyltransferase family 4 protein [Dysgonomonas sp. 216]NDW19243.1 glycosyltransferase [Dysgonomonas sp. 216]
MNITFISKFPDININNWSGTEYYILKSLEQQGADLDCIAGLKDILSFPVKIKMRLFGRSKKYWVKRSPEVGKAYANQIVAQLKSPTDIIFSASTESIAYLDAGKPKAFYTDATFASMIGYYDWFDNLSQQTYKEGMKMERQAINSSNLAFYSSDWAAQSAINDYGANPDKVKVVPFGANVNLNLSYEDVKNIVTLRNNNDVCKILFLAVEWERKGGDIVVETVKYLNEVLKQPTELHLVGIDNLPVVDELPVYIINHGRISKSIPEGVERIENLIQQSHFLFVPSRAEAYGVVFCESMAFGVPCISSNTGGIPTIIKDGENGALLQVGASIEEYAKRIYSIFSDKKRYEDMSLYAFNDYKTRLNWDVAGQTIMKYLKEL